MNDEVANIQSELAKEQALRASDAIIEISADAIITINESQQIIRYNNGAEEIFGYTHAEILGQTIDVLIPSRFRANHPAQIRGFAESPVVARRMGERRQISGLRKSGEEFPAEASISKTQIGSEWIYTVALRDVTERVRGARAQHFLAQATALLNSTLDAAQTLESIATLSIPLLGDWCVVFLRRSDGVFDRAVAVHQNPACAPAMEALASIPFTPKPDHALLPCLNEGFSILQPDFDDDAIREWSEIPRHYLLLRELNPVSMIAVPLRGRDQHAGAICFFIDHATKRVHDRDDLELAEELARRAGLALDNARLYTLANAAVTARDDVLAVVSHDLGNPLAAIRLSSAALAKMLAQGENAAALEQVENIRSAVLHMDRLLNDLLDIKRIEAGFMSLELERIPASQLLDEVVRTYAALADARNITLTRQSVDADTTVIADRGRIAQVFSNLVGNALKFSPPGQSIVLGADVAYSVVEFSIGDTGPGIPAEHLAHIFDRFWQVRRTGRQGIGLGLAIVKGIIDAHSGTIRVSSELGEGTTFTFTLPLAPSTSID